MGNIIFTIIICLYCLGIICLIFGLMIESFMNNKIVMYIGLGMIMIGNVIICLILMIGFVLEI